MHARHDEILVAVCKGLLLSGWTPKRLSRLLNVSHRAVALWSAGVNFKNIKPDFSVAEAMRIAAEKRLCELGLPENAPRGRAQRSERRPVDSPNDDDYWPD